MQANQKKSTKTQPETQRARRKSSKPLSKRQKAQVLERHIKNAQKIDAAIMTNTWKLADELYAIVAAYRKCHGRYLNAKNLQAMTKLDRDPNRMMLMAKVAKFFPPVLRRPGAGLRIYEQAYKFNQSLKSQDRPKYTAEEIAEIIKDASSATEAQWQLKHAADARDEELIDNNLKELVAMARSNAQTERLSAKKWLRAYDQSPPTAIAAAVKLLPERFSIDHINNALQNLGVEYELTERGPIAPPTKSSRVQPDLFGHPEDQSVPSPAIHP